MRNSICYSCSTSNVTHTPFMFLHIDSVDEREEQNPTLKLVYASVVSNVKKESFVFLVQLISALSEQLSERVKILLPPGCEAEGRYLEHVNAHPSIFRQLFCGVQSIKTICFSCSTSNVTHTPFMFLHIDSVDEREEENPTLKDTMLKRFRDKHVELNCNICAKRHVHIRSISLSHHPEILVLKLRREKRFSYHQAVKRSVAIWSM
ncbi:unnamed protein product [Larinioides sclopetarius]|uniref:USP domain-containing protein n=1 Tax=Larinioides sclopetarius TaxID=280406 RepID=A0AAV2A0W2_9ARAC